MSLSLQKFSREYLENASKSERKFLLLEMTNILTHGVREEYFEQDITQVINELRENGHDLGSFDWRDEYQGWCGN